MGPSVARAVCTDADSDSYCGSGGFPTDCDDLDAMVHPNRFELVGDGLDDNCDGRDALRRFLGENRFMPPVWVQSGWVSAGLDTVLVGSPVSAASSITRSLSVGRTHEGTAEWLVVGTSGSGAWRGRVTW